MDKGKLDLVRLRNALAGGLFVNSAAQAAPPPMVQARGLERKAKTQSACKAGTAQAAQAPQDKTQIPAGLASVEATRPGRRGAVVGSGRGLDHVPGQTHPGAKDYNVQAWHVWVPVNRRHAPIHLPYLAKLA